MAGPSNSCRRRGNSTWHVAQGSAAICPIVPAVVDRRVLPCRCSSSTHPKRPAARWLAAQRDPAAAAQRAAKLAAMCGIAGIVGSSASVETARSMAQRLHHRGPDGDGAWAAPGVALAHRRLAILDLSEGGHQPMLFGSQVLTYNGEIYNHEQLRAGLTGPWHSTGDTEVLVHLLAKQGSPCLDRLVGMFAFAAWDVREQRLLLVRDRLGMKPLYYQVLPDGIAFASELKALLVLGQPEIDRSAVRDFLFHGYIPAPKSIYRGIAKLPAGHSLTWAEGRISIERYWNPSTAITVRSP